MKEYHKIEGLYKRSAEGDRRLMQGVFRNPAVELLKDCSWEFTEKIDGMNIRIMWDGHRVHLGGRTDRAMIPSRLLKHLQEKFLTTEAEEMFEQLFGDKPVMLVGEGYGSGIQKGGAYQSEQTFILFDVIVEDNYTPRDYVKWVALAFGIELVPIVCIGTIDDAVNFVKGNPKSTIGTADMEGVVGRPTVELCDRFGNRIIVKIKWDDMKEFV